MKTISIKVRDDIAGKVDRLTQAKKDELAKIVSLWAEDTRTIEDVISDISSYASKQGLTQEILDNLLKE